MLPTLIVSAPKQQKWVRKIYLFNFLPAAAVGATYSLYTSCVFSIPTWAASATFSFTTCNVSAATGATWRTYQISLRMSQFWLTYSFRTSCVLWAPAAAYSLVAFAASTAASEINSPNTKNKYRFQIFIRFWWA